jgi:hypothetical protein
LVVVVFVPVIRGSGLGMGEVKRLKCRLMAG